MYIQHNLQAIYIYIYTYRHLHVGKLRVREGRKESECFLLH